MDSPPAPPLVRWGVPALIVLLVFLAFGPALGAGFINWDDTTNFRDNPHYRGLGWDQLRWMWTNVEGHYMPLTWMTLGLDYLLWGMNAEGYHWTSVLLHAVNGILAYLFLLRLLRRARPDIDETAQRLAALGGALFFAVHPLRAESVAWITERRDLVCGLFFLGSLLAYLRAVPADGGRARPGPLALSVALFGASLLGKPVSLPLPFVLLVMDVWPLRRLSPGPDGRRPWGRLLLEKIPYAALMLGAIGLTVLGTAEAGAFQSQDLPSRLMSPGYRLCFYLSKEILPWGLSPLYLYRPVESLLELKYLGTGLGALALTVLLARYRRRAPAALAAWLAFAILLGPMLGLVQAGPHFAADRYTYLASLPLAALVAALVLRGWSWSPRVAGAAGTAVAVLLVVLTLRQTDLWTDSEKLWTRAIEVDPSELAYNNRGTARAEKGLRAEAIADFDAALRLAPTALLPLVNRSEVRRQLGDARQALADAEAAVRAAPGAALAWNARAEARMDLGEVPGAEQDYTKALQIDPVLLKAYAGRAIARGMQGRLDEAIADCTLALRIHPFYVRAYLNRAVARIEKDDVAGGLEDYSRALRLAPEAADAWAGRGIAYALANRWREAAEDFRQALQVAGDRPWPRRADTRRRLDEALRKIR